MKLCLRSSGGGSVINTVSVAALHAGEDHAAYGVSKAAVVSLTRYVASMYGRDGIRCNAIAPGLVMSDTSKRMLSEHDMAEYAAERALPWAAETVDIATWRAGSHPMTAAASPVRRSRWTAASPRAGHAT